MPRSPSTAPTRTPCARSTAPATSAALPHPHGPGRSDAAAGAERPLRGEPDERRVALVARDVRHRRVGQRRRAVPRLPQRDADLDRLGRRPTPIPARDRGTWQYTVSAIDAAGNEGPQSAPVSVLYDATPPPAPSALGPADLDDPADAHLDRGRAGRALGLRPLRAAARRHDRRLDTRRRITDVGLTQNGSHTYAVRAVDAAGNASAATPVQRASSTTPLPRCRRTSRGEPDEPPERQLDRPPGQRRSGGVVYSIFRDGGGTPIATTAGTSTSTRARSPRARTATRWSRPTPRATRAPSRSGAGHGRRDAAGPGRARHRRVADAAPGALVGPASDQSGICATTSTGARR